MQLALAATRDLHQSPARRDHYAAVARIAARRLAVLDGLDGLDVATAYDLAQRWAMRRAVAGC